MATPALAEVIAALHDALPQKYRDNGIKAAVFNDWAPDEFIDESGQLAGWSVDIAHAIEDRLGVPFTYQGTSFDTIIPGLIGGRFDAGFSSFGANPERLKTLDFVSQRKLGTAFVYGEASGLDIRSEGDVCGLIGDGTYQRIMAKWGLDDAGMLKQALLITEENPEE